MAEHEDIKRLTMGLSNEMIPKLATNIHKGGWNEMTQQQILDRIKDEVIELETSINNNEGDEAVKKECADIANFCAMMIDNINRELNGQKKS